MLTPFTWRVPSTSEGLNTSLKLNFCIQSPQHDLPQLAMHWWTQAWVVTNLAEFYNATCIMWISDYFTFILFLSLLLWDYVTLLFCIYESWILSIYVRWRTVSTIFKCIYYFESEILCTFICYIYIILFIYCAFISDIYLLTLLHCLPYTTILWSLTRFISFLSPHFPHFPQTHFSHFPQTHFPLPLNPTVMPQAAVAICIYHTYSQLYHCYDITQSCIYNWY